ncbi:MAG TPA: DUF2630 family protein [Ktedonobacterales bacterium]|jgi:hypothetical protein
MQDSQVLNHITELMNEEHELLRLAERDGLDDTQRDRLHAIKVQLDQCWDLLRQRRAHREFGQNPDDAQERDPNTVERYQG